MALTDTLIEVKAIHAYAAVVLIGIAFTAFGLINQIQLAIVTLFFGFVALIDSLEDLSKSIDRVYRQMDEINDRADEEDDRDGDPDQDRDQG